VAKINDDLRSTFSLISLTVIGAFLGARAASLKDSWYIGPVVFCVILLLSFIYFSLMHIKPTSVLLVVNIFVQAVCAIFFTGMLIGNFWLAGGLIGSWIFCSLFFQIPIQFFEIKRND